MTTIGSTTHDVLMAYARQIRARAPSRRDRRDRRIATGINMLGVSRRRGRFSARVAARTSRRHKARKLVVARVAAVVSSQWASRTSSTTATWVLLGACARSNGALPGARRRGDNAPPSRITAMIAVEIPGGRLAHADRVGDPARVAAEVHACPPDVTMSYARPSSLARIPQRSSSFSTSAISHHLG